MKSCLALLLLAACGGGEKSVDPCLPSGKYTVSFVRSANPGDCQSFQPASQSLDVRPGQYCGTISTSSHDKDPATGCTSNWTLSGHADGDGVREGKAVLFFDCRPADGVCTANFDMYLDKR